MKNTDRHFNITVFAASSSNVRSIFLEAARSLGRILAKENFNIVYGGGKAGLMGSLAQGCIEAGGDITGIIPEFMTSLELENNNATRLIQTEDIHLRQKLLLGYADCIVTLPGGSGTLTEFYEAVSWKRLGLIVVPVIVLNIDGYYDLLEKQLEQMTKEGFMKKDYARIWEFTYSVEQTNGILKKYRETLSSPIKIDFDKE